MAGCDQNSWTRRYLRYFDCRLVCIKHNVGCSSNMGIVTFGGYKMLAAWQHLPANHVTVTQDHNKSFSSISRCSIDWYNWYVSYIWYLNSYIYIYSLMPFHGVNAVDAIDTHHPPLDTMPASTSCAGRQSFGQLCCCLQLTHEVRGPSGDRRVEWPSEPPRLGINSWN